MNVFEYQAINEAYYKNVASEIGFKPMTTFFADLSIAEFMERAKGVKNTYNRVMKNWIGDIKYITEFVLCLNWKAWQMHEKGNFELSKLYTDLYQKAFLKVEKHYKNDTSNLNYFYRMLD